MKKKALIMFAAIMLIGTMTTSCVDKKENQNTPAQQEQQQEQQQRRDQRNQQRDDLNPNPVDRINPDGTRG